MMMALCLGVLAWCAAFVTASAADRHPDGTPGKRALIEHAELRPEQGKRYAAFLTIFNGTYEQRVITSVKIAGFDALLVARKGPGGLVREPVANAVIAIPAHAELHMDTDTLFILMTRQEMVQRPTVVVTLDDGTILRGRASFLRPDQKVMDHRHG